MAATLRELTQKIPNLAERLIAISVTGQGDGLWPIGADFQPVGRAITWLDGRARPVQHQYEVFTKVKATSLNKVDNSPLFVLEVDYGGIFHVEGVPEDQLHPFLMIECPRLLFPFLRRILSDITRDGGFPPLNLDTIDFLQLYRQEAQRRASQTAPAPQSVS